MNVKPPNTQYDISVLTIACVLMGYILFFVLIYNLVSYNTTSIVVEQPPPQAPRVELKDMIKTAPIRQTDKEFLGVEPNSEVFPNIVENLDTIVISGTIEDFIAAAEPEMPREN